MCLKNLEVAYDCWIAGWKVFTQVFDSLLFVPPCYRVDTSITLQKVGSYVVMEYTKGGLYLEAENEKFYKAGIHVYLGARPLEPFHLLLQVVSDGRNSEIWFDESQACSVRWIVKRAIYQDKEYRYLALIKAMRKSPKFEIHDFWTIGGSKKEIQNNIRKFKRDLLFKDFKVMDFTVVDLK